MNDVQPLGGRRVVVTRGVEKGDRLNQLLARSGAAVEAVPMIETERLASGDAVRAAVARVRGGRGAAWLVFGSETAVRLVASSIGLSFVGLRIAAVGPATAAALRELGATADLVPDEPSGEALAGGLAGSVDDAARVLVFAAEGGRVAVSPALRAGGAEVETVLLYRSVMPEGAIAGFVAAVTPPPQAVVFTSTSTVRHAAIALDGASPPECLAACIGRPTADAASAAGWADVAAAERPTPEALLEVLLRRLASPQSLR